jgi:excisionase family DNA binding protein
MATGDDRPELAFSAASRQRLVRQLLQAEMARSEHGRTLGLPSPTTRPDRHPSRPPPTPTPPGADMSSTERPTLSVAETADLLGISRWLVQQAAHDGSLPSVRVGRRILIPRSRLLAWLDGQKDPGAPGPGRDAASTADPTLPVLAPRSPYAS